MITALAVLAAIFTIAIIVIIAWGLWALFHDPGEHALPRRQPPGEPPAWLPAPVPVIHHGEYRPVQWYHEPPAVTAPAEAAGLTAVLVIFAAVVVRQQAWQAEVLEVFPPRREPFTSWLSDDTLARGMKAIPLAPGDRDTGAPLCMPFELHTEPEGV